MRVCPSEISAGKSHGAGTGAVFTVCSWLVLCFLPRCSLSTWAHLSDTAKKAFCDKLPLLCQLTGALLWDFLCFGAAVALLCPQEMVSSKWAGSWHSQAPLSAEPIPLTVFAMASLKEVITACEQPFNQLWEFRMYSGDAFGVDSGRANV